MAGDEAASKAATSIHRSPSRPQLDLSGATIQGSTEDKNPAIVLPNQSDELSHFAIDIGGGCFLPLLCFPVNLVDGFSIRPRAISIALGRLLGRLGQL